MPVEFDIPAEGELGVQMFYSKVPFTEDRFAEVVELQPSNRAVLHHAGIYFVDIPEGARIVDGRIVGADGKAIGDRGRARPAVDRSGAAGFEQAAVVGAGPRPRLSIAPTSASAFPPASTSTGRCTTTRPASRRRIARRLGIWFNKVPVTHEVLIRQAGDPLATTKGGLSLYRAEGREVEYKADESSTRRRSKTPNIPPYVENWRLTGITPVTEDITLYAMSPHMHLRGKSLKWVIVYPDGREQTILNVPKFDFNWQFNYELEEPLKIPAGSKILGIGVYDNSPKNKWNPGAAARGVLVGAELGRDVPAVHRVLRRQPAAQRDDRREAAIASLFAIAYVWTTVIENVTGPVALPMSPMPTQYGNAGRGDLAGRDLRRVSGCRVLDDLQLAGRVAVAEPETDSHHDRRWRACRRQRDGQVADVGDGEREVRAPVDGDGPVNTSVF